MNSDASELLAYARHLDNAFGLAEPELSKVVERGALNVKRDAQTLLRTHSRRRYLQHYYRSISYDMLGPLEAEVGPDASKLQGGMGRGVEFGSAHTGPAPHLLPAFEEEQPRLLEQATNAVWWALK